MTLARVSRFSGAAAGAAARAPGDARSELIGRVLAAGAWPSPLESVGLAASSSRGGGARLSSWASFSYCGDRLRAASSANRRNHYQSMAMCSKTTARWREVMTQALSANADTIAPQNLYREAPCLICVGQVQAVLCAPPSVCKPLSVQPEAEAHGVQQQAARLRSHKHVLALSASTSALTMHLPSSRRRTGSPAPMTVPMVQPLDSA